MIITTNVDNTVTNVTNTSDMGVIADGRMFKLLLNNLYTDPCSSILRELSCNAIDAHKSINNMNSFHIQLPSLLDSTFIIRDFGPGLDEDEINKYLNTLFSSSKTTSNDYIGSFGLGSKVAFSLVSSFNIESYKDGIKYTGLWYEKDCGTPTLIIIDRSPTTEPNGLKFIVPLGDTNNVEQYPDKFKQAADNTLYNLPIQPKYFYNIDDLTTEYEFNYTAKLVSYDPTINTRIFSLPNYIYTNRFLYVNLGGIVYPSQIYLDSDIYNYVLSNGFKKLVIDIPIGELSLPMNRESIENTSANTQKILTYYTTEVRNKIYNDYFQEIQNLIVDPDFTFKKLFNILNVDSGANKYSFTQKLPKDILDALPSYKILDAFDLSVNSAYNNNLSSYSLNTLRQLNYFNYNSILGDYVLSTLNWHGSIATLSYNYVDHHNDFVKIRSSGKNNRSANNVNFNKLYVIYKNSTDTKSYSAYSIKEYFKNKNYVLTNQDTVLFINIHNQDIFEYYKEFMKFVNYHFDNETIFIDYTDIPKVNPPRVVKQSTSVSSKSVFTSGVKFIQYSGTDLNNSYRIDVKKSSLSTFQESVLLDSTTKTTLPFNITNYFKFKSSDEATVVLVQASFFDLTNISNINSYLKLKIDHKTIKDNLIVITASPQKYDQVLSLLKNDSVITNLIEIKSFDIIPDLITQFKIKFIDTNLDTNDIIQMYYMYYCYLLTLYCSTFNTFQADIYKHIFKYLHDLYVLTSSDVIIISKEDDEFIRNNLEPFFNFCFKAHVNQNEMFYSNTPVVSYTNFKLVSYMSQLNLFDDNINKLNKSNFKDIFIQQLLDFDVLNKHLYQTISISNTSSLVCIRDQFLNKFNFTL